MAAAKFPSFASRWLGRRHKSMQMIRYEDRREDGAVAQPRGGILKWLESFVVRKTAWRFDADRPQIDDVPMQAEPKRNPGGDAPFSSHCRASAPLAEPQMWQPTWLPCKFYRFPASLRYPRRTSVRSLINFSCAIA